MVFYTKNGNGDYFCNICKQSTLSLWKHLEKCHLCIYRDLKPSSTLNLLTNFFPKKNNYLGRTQDLTKERCIDLVIKTNITFETLDNPEFEAFCPYFAQCDVSLPSENTLRRGVLTKLDDEKVKMLQLF